MQQLALDIPEIGLNASNKAQMMRFDYDIPPLFYVARTLANRVHKDQRDDGNNPYMQHVCTVVNTVASFYDPLITLTAMLHDTIERAEDRGWMARCIQRVFPQEVYVAVTLLTRITGERYDEHIARVIGGGRIPVVVKRAEITDNLRGHRMPDPNEGQVLRMAQYRDAYLLLSMWWDNRFKEDIHV